MRFVTSFFAVIGALAVLGALVVIVVLATGAGRGPTVPRKAILMLDLRGGVIEHVHTSPALRLSRGPRLAMLDIVEGMQSAATDPRIKGLLVDVSAVSAGYAHVQEIRDAIARFRASGKPTCAFAETFGEMSPGLKAYYLATACDTIIMQPSGALGLTGLLSQAMFIEGALEKLDIQPQLDHRKEYKSALYTVTRKEFAEPQKKAIDAVLQSLQKQLAEGIANRRRLSAEQALQTLERGPLSAQQGLDAGLIDQLAYRDQAVETFRERLGFEAELFDMARYAAKRGRYYTGGEKIACIYGVGSIVRGRSRDNPITGARVMGSVSIAQAFREAIDDKNVRAIVFRIESPGGSYVASDIIWRETVRAQKAGKPVIVSMANVAGSGGYFIAMSADKIVAQPATLTGSIGVISGKAITRGLWNKAGVTWDELYSIKNATYWSSLDPYTPEQWQRLQRFLDRIYNDFTAKAAAGRNLDSARIEQAAGGRIWSGADALDLGLVDTMGGLAAAVALAKEAADIPVNARVKLETLPRKKSLLSRLLSARAWSSAAENQIREQLAVLREEAEPVARVLDKMYQSTQPGVLRMDEFTIE
jgi:protease-4